jgi:uncharacterized protein (DUF433 family)
MALTATEFKHIVLDDRNVPFIEGSTMKVVEVVMAQQANGWTAEEIYANHPYLSMSQIHAALAYYWDHKQALDEDIKRRDEYVRAAQEAAGESPFAARLRAQGLLK